MNVVTDQPQYFLYGLPFPGEIFPLKLPLQVRYYWELLSDLPFCTLYEEMLKGQERQEV